MNYRQTANDNGTSNNDPYRTAYSPAHCEIDFMTETDSLDRPTSEKSAVTFLPSNRWERTILMLIGEYSRFLEGCDWRRWEYSFSEKSAIDSSSMGAQDRLSSSWHVSHAVVKPLQE